jgi:hypothetical protein
MGIKYSFTLVKSGLKLHYGMIGSVEMMMKLDSEMMFQNALNSQGEGRDSIGQPKNRARSR